MTFDEWFYSEPHRAKYPRDHPAYLAAQEAWDGKSDKQEAVVLAWANPGALQDVQSYGHPRP